MRGLRGESAMSAMLVERLALHGFERLSVMFCLNDNLVLHFFPSMELLGVGLVAGIHAAAGAGFFDRDLAE